ncbi:MAG: MarR family transcriptional regulator [Deltaproteobacteria bacterium]|nr:MarR family transcriptional regulator [Deltaproteobacteria bacterium]
MDLRTPTAPPPSPTTGHDDDDAHALLRLDAQLCFPLYAASNLVTRAYRPLLEPLGLTYPQYIALLALWEGGALSVRALGERLLLDSGTLSPLLSRLEQRGLVSRAPHPGDRRQVVVRPTAAGWALRAQAAGVPQALLCRVFGGRPPESDDERAALLALRGQLQQLVVALQRAVDPVDPLPPPEPTA